MPFIGLPEIAVLAGAYPSAPAMLRHSLAGEQLLTFPALADAARRLPPEHVERRVHDARDGEDFALCQWQGDPAGMIEGGPSGNHWIMLRFIEQLPEYRDLIHQLMHEIEPAILDSSGRPENVKGFVFISAPGTHTPFHFDAEYNILFQVSGEKVFATYPPRLPFLSLPQREAYHQSGANMLDWDASFGDRANRHDLTPGDALYVPYAAPHWVRSGAEPTVSLSVTWQSAWSRNVADALSFNAVLRKLRLPAGDMPEWPANPRWRAMAQRAARRLRLA